MAAVSAARAAWQDAMTARERATVKIAEALPPVPGGALASTDRLATLDRLRTAGRWTRLAAELDVIEEQAAAAAAACREARTATPSRCWTGGTNCAACSTRTGPGRPGSGPSSTLELEARYDRARELLWTAPCDLAAAADAVTGYQQAVLALSGRGTAMTASARHVYLRPGCTGTIDGGYCDACGLAAGLGHPAVARAAGPGIRSRRDRGPPRPRREHRHSGPPGLDLACAGSAAGLRLAPAAGRTGTGPRRRGGSRRTRPGSSRSSRGRLGAGLVDIPPVPARDPAAAVLADPQVRRASGSAARATARSGGAGTGSLGSPRGAAHTAAPGSRSRPSCSQAKLVGDQYEVLGCLAHGGLGWIYLAMDRHLGNRWVVLKGLLNSGDTAAQEAAVAERRFLAEVEHPNIVDVYNFVQHADRQTGEVAGYIVMEYVGGKSLKQILQERRQAGQSLPVPVALAYAIEVLPALGYLHSQGLVYCDFKPDNVIQTEEQLKLIDMGGVRRIDDDRRRDLRNRRLPGTGDRDRRALAASDLYTVGRALAVLTFEFAGYQGKYANSLPEPAGVPVLAEHESFLRAHPPRHRS